MEVHHHPHLEHKIKPLREYFLEFIMIFIAVTLGFFAESYREHLSDNAKGKEYIESLVQDLQGDQQLLQQNIDAMSSGINMMDTLITLLNNFALLSTNTGDLYYLARLAPRIQPLTINNKTFEQLQNSGNFRLIKNINTSNKIVEYYSQLSVIRLLESINETEFTQYKQVASKVLDPEVLIKSENKDNSILRRTDNPPLRTMDKELLQELSVFAVYMHGTKGGLLDHEIKIKDTGSKLIEYLHKEYNLPH